jgi:hypothetical protein
MEGIAQRGQVQRSRLQTRPRRDGDGSGHDGSLLK